MHVGTGGDRDRVVAVGNLDERDAGIALIQERTQADLIARIGNVAAFYRANPQKRDPLPVPKI